MPQCAPQQGIRRFIQFLSWSFSFFQRLASSPASSKCGKPCLFKRGTPAQIGSRDSKKTLQLIQLNRKFPGHSFCSSPARKYINGFKEAEHFFPLCGSQSWPRHFPLTFFTSLTCDQELLHLHDWRSYSTSSSYWRETLKHLRSWASHAEPQVRVPLPEKRWHTYSWRQFRSLSRASRAFSFHWEAKELCRHISRQTLDPWTSDLYYTFADGKNACYIKAIQTIPTLFSIKYI